MRFSIFTALASIFIRTSFGGALQVIDHGGQCVMWSNDNHGCTGYSGSFGRLNGSDCSELSEVINGTRQEFTVLNVDACGTEEGQNVAWIRVNQTGLVTFFNQNGDKSACTLNNGLKTGSWCNVSESGPVTSTIPSSIPVLSSNRSSAANSSVGSALAAFWFLNGSSKGNLER